ncbi:hypothetical protein BXZ70DRAFT_952611 [Cristinia sonorae]|uniref:Uncharacterized protein n=1 Tax=Cristinia sonorae TaxID=1940300 RepID=A0A8K0XLV7_9AGAR|nr:hypothetical protein BXZ70DRAFT_952611 [Cristinia sonorae]
MENSRPTKRPRHEPDGFASPTKPTQPVRLPAFTSGFDPGSDQPTSKPTTSRRSSPKRPRSIQQPSSRSSPANRPVKKLVAPLHPFVPDVDSPLTAPSTPRRPPPHPPVPFHRIRPHETPQRKKPVKREPPVSLKTIRHLALPDPQPSRELQPCKPPPVPAAKPLPVQRAQPISKTRVAQNMNPMSEDGASELFALALQGKTVEDVDLDVVWVTREEKELARGLIVSPEKAAKARGKGSSKYISGGLAENALRLFAASQTSVRLWDARHSNNHKKPDLRVRVLAVLHTSASPSLNTRSPAALHPLTTLARCHVLASADPQYAPRLKTKVIMIPFGTPQQEPEMLQTEVCVLFRVDRYDLTGGVPLAKRIREGVEVGVWERWMTVPVEMLGGLGEGENVVRKKEVLFCLRFAVVPSD